MSIAILVSTEVKFRPYRPTTTHNHRKMRQKSLHIPRPHIFRVAAIGDCLGAGFS